MIVCTGATGKLGRRVVERLLERVAADQIGVSVRDPDGASSLVERGVRVRRGDFNDPTTLDAAFEGADTVLLVSAGNPDESAAVDQHRSAIDAAERAGASRVVYTSHMGANPASKFSPMRVHAATEDVLRESGVAFTSLRNGYYTATVNLFLGDAPQTGSLALAADGPVSWTDHDDLAEVAAIILTDGGFEGVTPALTAGRALDMAEAAEIAAEVTGRPITVERVSDEAFQASLTARGMPAGAAAFLTTVFHASRDGEFAAVDPTLAELLGREPRTVREVLAATLSAAR